MIRVIVSGKAKSGKSRVAYTIAEALREAGCTVIVIDDDIAEKRLEDHAVPPGLQVEVTTLAVGRR